MNFINKCTYWHEDGVVEAGLSTCQLIGGGKILGFPVTFTEETSICFVSRQIHIKRAGNVQAVVHCVCKGIQ